jgi:hypothetical protein
MKLRPLLYGLLAFLIPALAFAESRNDVSSSGLKSTVILIIRHAEEPDGGDGLSSVGEARANAYTNYFKNFTIDDQQIKLDHMFAAADSHSSHRPRLTLEPTAKELGLKIDTQFKNKEYLELVDKIKKNPGGANILICWHHGNIPELLRALGVDTEKLLPKDRWPGHVFNWLIELRYDGDGNLHESKRIDEKLLPED